MTWTHYDILQFLRVYKKAGVIITFVYKIPWKFFSCMTQKMYRSVGHQTKILLILVRRTDWMWRSVIIQKPAWNIRRLSFQSRGCRSCKCWLTYSYVVVDRIMKYECVKHNAITNTRHAIWIVYSFETRLMFIYLLCSIIKVFDPSIHAHWLLRGLTHLPQKSFFNSIFLCVSF